jgi:hypothetical protein
VAHPWLGGPSLAGWPILRSLIAKGGLFALRANRLSLSIQKSQPNPLRLPIQTVLLPRADAKPSSIHEALARASAVAFTSVFAVAFIFPRFSAQKSHVKPKNHLTHSNQIR